MNQLQRFLAELLEQEQAVLEPIEPEGLEVLCPPGLQRALNLPELARLGFGAELPPGAQRVSLESDWMERLGSLLGERGHWVRRIVNVDCPMPGSPERILQHNLELLNATYRLQKIEPAWTRYWIFTFRYTALSDEKRDGIVYFGLNLANGATLDAMLDELIEQMANLTGVAEAPPVLPPPWERSRLETVLERALLSRVRHRLEPFLKGMMRRQERDLQRLYDYHNDLRREARQRLAAIPAGGTLSDRQKADKEREQLRLEAIAREYRAKVNDLRQKYAMNVELEWVQTLESIMPVQRFTLLIKRRKGERVFQLDWNPATRRLEQAPCEYSFTGEAPREVCDEALHLISPAAHGPCVQCEKPYCRACHPVKCPKCGHPTEL